MTREGFVPLLLTFCQKCVKIKGKEYSYSGSLTVLRKSYASLFCRCLNEGEDMILIYLWGYSNENCYNHESPD